MTQEASTLEGRVKLLLSDFKKLKSASRHHTNPYNPLEFSEDILSGKFDVPVNIREKSMIIAPEWLGKEIKRYSLLDNYYHFKDSNYLNPITDALFELYSIGQKRKEQFHEFLEKELKIFDGDRRENGSLQYIHQLQVAATVAGYLNYHLHTNYLQKFFQFFNKGKLAMHDKEKLVVFYSVLGHDTPEDGFPEGLPLSKRLEGFRRELLLDEIVAGRVVNIVGALTRIDEEGKEIEYQATAEKISGMNDTKDRSVAFMIKLGDRIVNMRTLGNLGKKNYEKGDPKPKDPEWHIKNVYKTYVMLAEVKEQLENGIHKKFRPVIEAMYNDLLSISRKELKEIKSHYIRANPFTVDTEIETRKKDPIDFALSVEEFERETLNWTDRVTYDDINYADVSESGAYALVSHRRAFSGYLDKLRSLVRARRNYKAYILENNVADRNSWEEVQRENEAKKIKYLFDGLGSGIMLLNDSNLISDKPNISDSCIIDRFDSHFEAKILEKGNGEITYKDFFVHLLSEKWIYAYKLKSQVENEFQEYRFKNNYAKKPFSNLGYEELIRQNKKGNTLKIGQIPGRDMLEELYDSHEEIRKQSKSLFGFAQCEYLDDMLHTLRIPN